MLLLLLLLLMLVAIVGILSFALIGARNRAAETSSKHEAN